MTKNGQKRGALAFYIYTLYDILYLQNGVAEGDKSPLPAEPIATLARKRARKFQVANEARMPFADVRRRHVRLFWDLESRLP